jgi:hypothetical protein
MEEMQALRGAIIDRHTTYAHRFAVDNDPLHAMLELIQ